MVEQALRKLSPVDPGLLGDPAAVEEIYLQVLAEAGTLSDLSPVETDLDATDPTLF